MAWKNCSVCGWSYNDKKGGCRNSACKSFDPSSVASPSSSKSSSLGSPKNPFVPKTVVIPKTVVVPKKQVVPPKFQSSASVFTSSSVMEMESVEPDTPIIPWVETSTTKSDKKAPKGVALKAEPFTLICYRGEKSEWWPEPRMRLAGGGMNVFEPWPCATIADSWKNLVEEVKKKAGFNEKSKAAAYAQFLRATGRPFALASARTKGGAFEGYSYVIEIENARTFHWGKNCTLGPPANFKDTNKTTYEKLVNQNVEIWSRDTIDADYIVLNADTIEESTILGFGHKTGTYEVTFLHDLPLSFIKSVNGKVPSALGIYSEEQLKDLPDDKHRKTALKLFRPK